jgi:galactokinase
VASPSPSSLSALAAFTNAFGDAPDVLASAPGRVNLLGEHVDYNGGEVLPIAIERRTYVAVRRSGAARSRAFSSAEVAVGAWDPLDPRRGGEWWDYVAGIQGALVRRGAEPVPIDLGVWSDLPAGAGLASSAALEVAAAVAIASLTSTSPDPTAVARLAHEVEREFVGVACGIMDQFASAYSRRGSALHLRCGTETFEHVPFGDIVLVFDTAVPRRLRASRFNARREECARALELLRTHDAALPNLAAVTPALLDRARLPAVLARRARHVIEEIARVEQAVSALRTTGAIPGELLYASHESARDLYECSTEQLDWFVERARGESGVRGARLTGAGWGGCAIAFGSREALEEWAPRVAAGYRERFGITPRTWLSAAGEGARVDSRG